MAAMQKLDLEAIARNRRVQDLCRELAQLLTLSLEQRRTIDRLLSQLEEVTRSAKTCLRPLAQVAGAGASARERGGTTT
jgi:hypothetical protein